MKKSQSLAFTALLCAVHILIIFMTEYVPFFDLALIFFVPIFSAILTVKCQFRYSAILFISTMIIGLIINPVNAVLSLMTPLVYGITYGLLLKHNAKSTSLVYLLTLAVTGLLLLDMQIIKIALNEDFIQILCNFFHVDSFYHSQQILFILIAFVFCQAFVIHFTLKFTLKKMKIKVESNKYPPFFLLLLTIGCILFAALIKNPVYRHVGYILATIFAVPYVLYALQKNKALVPLLITTAVVFLAVVIPLLKYVNENYRYLTFLIVLIPSFCYGVFRQFKENNYKEVLTNI